MGAYLVLVFLFFYVTVIVTCCNEAIQDGAMQKSLRNVDNYSNRINIRTPSSKVLADSRKKKDDKQDVMSKILPMMVIPFMLQTIIIPVILTSLKFMLFKSAIIGKIAIFVGLLNMFLRSNNQGGLHTHNINLEHDQLKSQLSHDHYGYSGGSEYGAYIND